VLIIKAHNSLNEVIQRNKQDACGDCEKDTDDDFFLYSLFHIKSNQYGRVLPEKTTLQKSPYNAKLVPCGTSDCLS
jgi:hypothetical protein